MNEPIYIYRYTLQSRSALNSKSVRNEHHGALLRVGESSFGYGCIHPWPELGDVELDQTLAFLARGKHTALSRRALTCAEKDGSARREGINLFDDLTIPRSHATLIMDGTDLQTAVDAGFDMVKVKVGKELDQEIEFIRKQVSRFPQLRWRLDFNGTLDSNAVEKFLQKLGEEVIGKIDFIEDAYLPGNSPWVNALGPYHIPMAVDREIESACGGFGVAVIKPALNVAEPLLERALDESRRVVFTSYMDHPLGQCFAAWEAAVTHRDYPGLVDTCGLITHGLFESDAFTEALGKPEPGFHPPAGTGLGFDDLLESLPWKRLN